MTRAAVLRGPTFEVAARPPHPALGAFVRRLVGFAEHAPAPIRRLEMPASSVALIVGFEGDGWAIEQGGTARGRHAAFAAGLHGTAAVTEQHGRVAGVQADLTPEGAHRLLAVSMAELAGTVAPLNDAAGGDPATRALAEQLGAAADWDARLDLTEAWLARRLDRTPAGGAPHVAHAVRRLRETGGTVPVGVLCEEIGWSRRHLAKRFREHTGVTPKAMGRLVRFERAVAALAGEDRPDLARVALDCGYADQAHFTREFHGFAGLPPGAYVRHRADPAAGISGAIAEVTSVQDPSSAAA